MNGNLLGRILTNRSKHNKVWILRRFILLKQMMSIQRPFELLCAEQQKGKSDRERMQRELLEAVK